MNKMQKILIIAAVVAAAATVTAFFLTRTPSPFVRFAEMQVGEGEVAVLFLGDSSFILRTNGHTIIVDPASRVSADAAKSLGKINAILITHEHSDHFVASAASELYRATEGTVVANSGAYEDLKGLIQRPEKLIKLGPGQRTKIEGIVLEGIASNHSGSSPLMYVITMDGVTILHGSDSGFSLGLENYSGKIDMALIATGGPSPTASPLQAYKIAATLRPKKVIPIHGSSPEHSEFKRLLATSPNISPIDIQELSPEKVSLA